MDGTIMKINDANSMYVGSSTVSRVYDGIVQVWPRNGLNAPEESEYSLSQNSGWGSNYLHDGDHLTISGTRWFGAWTGGSNVTSQYTWTISGGISVNAVERLDPDNTQSRILKYQYRFTGAPATLVISDPQVPSRKFLTITFN